MKKICGILMAILSLTLISGCTGAISSVEKNTKKQIETFNTEIALNAHEYSFIFNKEITAACGVLTSQMIMSHNVASNGASIKRAESSLRGSQQTIEVCLEVLKSTYPSSGYEDDRESAIECLNEILDIFDKYEKLLKSGKLDGINEITDSLQTEFNILTSYQNIYYN